VIDFESNDVYFGMNFGQKPWHDYEKTTGAINEVIASCLHVSHRLATAGIELDRDGFGFDG
jgi:hypothetical protein